LYFSIKIDELGCEKIVNGKGSLAKCQRNAGAVKLMKSFKEAWVGQPASSPCHFLELTTLGSYIVKDFSSTESYFNSHTMNNFAHDQF
jgi:hypothetical protein